MGFTKQNQLVKEGDVFNSDEPISWAVLLEGEVAPEPKSAAPVGESLSDIQAGKTVTLSKDLEDARAEIAALKSSAAVATHDLSALQTELDTAKANAVEPSNVSKLKADLKAAQAKIEEHLAEIVALTEANVKWEEAYEDLKADIQAAADNKPPNDPG